LLRFQWKDFFHMTRLLPYLLLAGAAAYAAPQPARTVVLPAGTSLQVRLDRALDTKQDAVGTPFTASVITPVVHNDEVIVPKGAICRGRVVQSKASGKLKGRAVMGLALDTVSFRGRTYPIQAAGPVFTSNNHKKHNLKWIGGGSAGGTAIGALAGGGVGAAVGLGLGAAGGTAGAALTGQKQVYVAAETPMVFTLQHPVQMQGPARK
jgi:hypothetical protein